MWRFVTAGQTPAPAGEKDPRLVSTNNHQGRQTWEFHADAGTPEERAEVERLRQKFSASRHTQKHSADELLRLQSASRIAQRQHLMPTAPLPPGVKTPVPAARVEEQIKAGISFYECIQADDGHWPGDYGGPMFLTPGLLIALYTTGDLDTVFTEPHKREALRYFRNHQNKDGGFGLHIEGGSTMFGTALTYVSARLLGLPADDPMLVDARKWIHDRKGAHWITSWGKFWLAVLGVYSWDGLNPMPPEMWLLPYSSWTGIGWLHPGRFWCHCRMVYLPMSYIYGRRGTCHETELVRQIRKELYPVAYEKIDWNAARNQVAPEDLYYPHPFIQDVLWWTLYQVEPWLLGSWLRKRALAECMKHIHYEDENTRYIDIGPVNKVLNMLACWMENPTSEAYQKHLPRVHDYLWVAEDGLKMQGYNGSSLWDTAFAVQALVATGMTDVAAKSLRKAHEYIKNSQVVDEAAPPLEKYYRHISKGAWPFSTRDHGWPISDCTSEGLKAALVLAQLPAEVVGEPIPKERLLEAVNVLLSYQNWDGGMATYENTRSFHWLEVLNPSETFGDIIVDYSYVECTSACIQALEGFMQKHPNLWKETITLSTQLAESFIRSIQREDGSWYGSWAVCFTYACWFGVCALAARGKCYDVDPAITKCCDFLLTKQREDGGWGESYLSCEKKAYHHTEGDSHVVNTAWAMLALLKGGYHRKKDPAPLHRAARYLLSKQLPNGDWPQQSISGVFNRNCMITYANYRNIFPLWALGLYRRGVLLSEDITNA